MGIVLAVPTVLAVYQLTQTSRNSGVDLEKQIASAALALTLATTVVAGVGAVIGYNLSEDNKKEKIIEQQQEVFRENRRGILLEQFKTGASNCIKFEGDPVLEFNDKSAKGDYTITPTAIYKCTQ